MDPRLRQFLLAGTMLAGVSGLGGAAEAAVCPAVGLASNCNLVITLNPGGTGSIATLVPGTYDGSDDVVVGVTNDSGQTVNAIKLTSATLDIFGFDGDGIETNPNPTSLLPGLGLTTSPPGYQGTDSKTGSFNLSGPFNSFSGITAAERSGIVNFPGGLVAGGSAFFSLEEPLTEASFTVVVHPTPEPATLTILGAALAGFGVLRRRRKTSV